MFPATKEKNEKKEECVFYRIDFLFQHSPFSVQKKNKWRSNKNLWSLQKSWKNAVKSVGQYAGKKRKMQRLKFETQDPSLVVYVLLIPNSEAERWKITTEAVKKSCGRNRKGGGLTHFESQSSVFYSRRIGFLLCVVFPNHLVKKPLAIFILGGLELFLMTRFPFFPF